MRVFILFSFKIKLIVICYYGRKKAKLFYLWLKKIKIEKKYRVAENFCQKLLNSIKIGFRYPFGLCFGGKCSASETVSFKISPCFDLLTNFC